jgi:hypothetical protein
MCQGLGVRVMDCRACGAEMRLMQVIVGGAMRSAPSIERHMFRCSACPHEARRLVFGALPISTTDAITRPQAGAIRVRSQRAAEPPLTTKLSSRQPREIAPAAKASVWARAVEKLHNRQAALKEREAAVSPTQSRTAPSQQASRHTGV